MCRFGNNVPDLASVKKDSESHIWVEQVVEKVDPFKKNPNYLLLLIFLPMVMCLINIHPKDENNNHPVSLMIISKCFILTYF